MYPVQTGTNIQGQSHLKQTHSTKDNNKNRIRVSTFNIYKASSENWNGKKTIIEGIADQLSKDHLSGLQEVLGESIFGAPDQAKQIAQLNNLGWLFAPAQTRFNRVYTGNGLLSQIPVKSWEITSLVWSDIPGNQARSRNHRNKITAKMNLGGKEVVVMTTHLDRHTIRPAQLQSVLAEFERYDYAILLADLNTLADEQIIVNWLKSSKSMDMIATALKENDPVNRVDWILTRGFKLIQGGIKDQGLSDHPYYWAEIELVD